ncbi:hypothetical protein [uncultured Gimesia sp.]|uniref:hypothetical protein n=1 Tax=uncultured Gimesia sp. TaxID=1678688 RepID=UPI0030DD240D|tara:strand:+ start:32367 stop:32600 length:234 start_codon:yes stop_codon:yes gene_type:complete
MIILLKSSSPPLYSLRRVTIAKNQNTFAKRQREADKKAKAEAKRIRRNKLKEGEIVIDPHFQHEIDREPINESDEPN